MRLHAHSVLFVCSCFLFSAPPASDSYCVGLWSCLPEGLARRCLGTLCAFPPEYFEAADGGGDAAHGLHSHSPGPLLDGVSELSDGRGGAGSAYHAMHGGADETTKDSGSASSQLLPPGSFVPSSTLYSPEAYKQAGSVHSGIGGIGLQQHRPFYPMRHNSGGGASGAHGAHGSLAQQSSGLGLPQLSAGPTQDLYGSPTWLNAQHPALANLTPSPNVGPQPSYPAHQSTHVMSARMEQGQQQQEQQQQSQAASTRQLYDDDDSVGAQPPQPQPQQPARQPLPRARH